jgi:hypothetical protein
MLPDGWEVGHGLDPCSPDSAASLSWDADGDGLGLFDEFRFCTDPSNPDTDGDGVSDGDEVPHSPGSCPVDASDNGDPANCVTLKLTVGDPSGSYSERWTMEVVEDGGPYTPVVRHCDNGFGSPGSAEYSLVKGKSYTFKVRWVATNYPSPDFDWRCWINDLASAGARPALYGTGAIVIEDPDGLMTDYTDGGLNNLTLGNEGKIHVLKIRIEPASTNVCWETQSTTLNLTEDSHPGGSVDWTVEPSSGLDVTSSDNASFTFSPTNSVPGEYTVTAASALLPDCKDECVVRVVKVDIVPAETNVCWTTQSATLALTSDSNPGGSVDWSVEPASGLEVTASDNASFSFSPTNSTPGAYTVTAASSLLPDCKDECVVRIVKATLKKLEFTSDHNVICNGTTVTIAGSRFPDVEWDLTVVPPVNAAITHTAGINATNVISLTLSLDAEGIPVNTAYTLTGSSSENALNFSKSGTISSGSGVTIALTADNVIGADIKKIEDKISWAINMLDISVDLGDTGEHVIYTTLGTPNTSAPLNASVPNVPRMELAVPIVASAITAAGGSDNHAKTVWEIVKAKGSYYLDVALSDSEAWTLPSLPNGADCLSISKFVRNVGMAMGIPGSFDAEMYAAYYCVTGDVDRPQKAVSGLRLNAPLVSPGDQGIPATAGLDPSWALALADMNCTKHGGGAASGTVGCGPDGLNAFEAAVIYTDQAARKWYFPGGTGFVYDDIDAIVQIFQTMVWVQYDDHDNNPLTPNVLVVKAVDYTYTTQPSVTP